MEVGTCDAFEGTTSESAIADYENTRNLSEVVAKTDRDSTQFFWKGVFNVTADLHVDISPLYFNPLNTKRRLLYLKTQFVPHSKNFSSLL